MTHLDALRLRLSNERARRDRATTPAEREMRAVLVEQCEREVASELALLGITETPAPTMSDDDLLAELA